MKNLLLFLFFLSINSFADSIEIVGGGLTYHIISETSISRQFSYQLSPDGRLIDNPIIGLSHTQETKDEFTSRIIYVGKNSFNEPMAGILYESGYVYGNWQVGGAIGIYEENSIDWDQINAIPPYLWRIGNTGLVPLFGIAINYKINLNKSIYLKFNNIISPLITNSSLSFGWTF